MEVLKHQVVSSKILQQHLLLLLLLLLMAVTRSHEGYKDSLMEVQALRVNYSSESKKREALESHIADLKTDNERLRRLYTETLFKFTNQMKFHTEFQSLKEELGKAHSRLPSMEEEHKREIKQLKHGNEMNSNALESKLSCALVQQATDEAGIKQLKLELGAHKAHIDMLSSRLEQVTADVHLQCNALTSLPSSLDYCLCPS